MLKTFEKYRRHIKSGIYALLLCFPIGGFLYGFFESTNKSNPSLIEEIKGRAIMGLFSSIGGIFTYGSPFGDNHLENLKFKLYLLITFFILFAILLKCGFKIKK